MRTWVRLLVSRDRWGAPDARSESHLASCEHQPEAETEAGAAGGPEAVCEAPEDHSRGLAVARGNPGA